MDRTGVCTIRRLGGGGKHPFDRGRVDSNDCSCQSASNSRSVNGCSDPPAIPPSNRPARVLVTPPLENVPHGRNRNSAPLHPRPLGSPRRNPAGRIQTGRIQTGRIQTGRRRHCTWSHRASLIERHGVARLAGFALLGIAMVLAVAHRRHHAGTAGRPRSAARRGPRRHRRRDDVVRRQPRRPGRRSRHLRRATRRGQRLAGRSGRCPAGP